MAEIQGKASEQNLSVLPGNEKQVGYTVLPIPEGQGRFAFTGSVFLSRLTKLIAVNLLMLLFFSPLVVIFFMRVVRIAQLGAAGAFGDNLGIGYPAAPDTVGLAEQLMFNVDVLFYALAVAASLVAAVGLAGGMYCARKLVRSDDKLKLFGDFFTGVKQGYVSAAIACLLAFGGILLAVVVWDYAAVAMAAGESAGLWIALRVVVCIVAALLILFGLWVFAVGSNYRQSALGLLKNAATLGGGTFIPSVLFAALAAFPALLAFINQEILNFIIQIFYVLVGFSAALLVWASFADWAFDRYAGFTALQTERQEQTRKEALRAETSEQDVMGLLLAERKHEFLSRAIRPLGEGTQIELLPDTFSLSDLEKLAQTRRTVAEESRSFAAAHADEEKYKEYNARFADREKSLEERDKKGKRKKFVPRSIADK